VLAFTVFVGRTNPFMGPGGDGFSDRLAVGVVEVAERFAAEGGGAAAVVVGEEVVAGRGWDGFHGWGLPPGYFWA